MQSNKLAIIVSLMLLSQQGFSEVKELDTAVAKAEEANSDIDLIDAQTIDQTGMSSITDIVRHIPGVQVNDTGDRFNDNGFNIRGLEGDSIALTVDGLAQGESLSPPSFAPYGMFGSNRGLIDLETVKAIKIVKGPSSVLSGSGALGGSVALTTKEPSDFLILNDELDGRNKTVGKVKVAYDDRSEELMFSGAIANRTGAFESLLMFVLRDGSETESYSSGGAQLGSEREQADPFDREISSILAKLIYS